uniref:ATP synthase complex subunit 8 n=1 Tax=Curculionoidea sp. 11 KM-2017 TaxID=2219394 RepID=A0A346RJY8_9CUCU|nr:ATP synthase F0 subunit 8 [Curculionoidea sp. 11 KM-2017]
MPQMAPLNWLSLFFFFLLIFILFNIMTYFLSVFKKKMSKKNIFFSKINWKW